MSAVVFGVVRGGRIVTEAPLPEGMRVEVRPCDERVEFTPEERAEFTAWETASADALDLVERPACEEPPHETR